jgi:hypothetical protein
MVRRGSPLGAVPPVLLLGQAALPLAASAQQAPGGRGSAHRPAPPSITRRRDLNGAWAVRASGPITLDRPARRSHVE